MFKNFPVIPKRLKLVLKINDTSLDLNFSEPTIYNLALFQEFIEFWEYEKALKLLWIEIDREIFYIAPDKIVLWIFDLLKNEEKKESQNFSNNEDNIFIPAFYDRIARVYNTHPLDIMQRYTPSQLNRIVAWYDYNNNIDNKKPWDNAKYRVFEKQDFSKYDHIFNDEKIKNYRFE